MYLIDVDNRLFFFAYFSKNLFETFFKVTTILGAGHHATQIQRKYLGPTKGFRYFILANSFYQSISNCSLSYPRFPDMKGIILILSAKVRKLYVENATFYIKMCRMPTKNKKN